MESVNLKALTKTEIFARATEEEVSSMLNCLSAKKKKYQKDEIIFHAGDIVSSIGVMLKGNALIENDDIWGNRSVLDYVKEGQIFAETYACALDEKLMVNVIAMSDCEVLFLDVRKILKVCPNACEFHQNLVQNLLAISAQKNLNLSRRTFTLHRRQSVADYCLICLIRQWSVKRKSSIFRITGSSLQIIWE